MINTETIDEYITFMAWGGRMDRMIAQADLDSADETTAPFDLDWDARDMDDESPCGHWACDCIA